MVNGKIQGVKDAYLDELNKIYDMDIIGGEIVSSSILDIMTEMTNKIGREISIYINRRGKVIDVSIGDYSSVDLPVLDYRRGDKRLSGVRCVHTHPNGSGKLSKVDISALIGLRLDAVVAVGVLEGKIIDIYMGTLVPVSGFLSDNYKISGPFSRDCLKDINIQSVIKEIEKELESNKPEETEEKDAERVFLVGLSLPGKGGSSEDLLNELEELASAAGAVVVGKTLQKRNKIDPAYYIGSGKARELSLLIQAYNVNTVIFDDELSGIQIRNLEDAIGSKVIDRTTLILDIFAKRAMTREGKLQVELAQLKYRSARLIGLGMVMSRTGGGIGTRGPGEKKLEIDRRRIRERIDELEKALLEVRKGRDIQRGKRKAAMIPVISLVGYTNSGKSTLRNKLANTYPCDSSINKEDVLEANMLFATLDPTTRAIKLPKGHEILVSDTVGFIRKLPHDLVDAFRATLEEVVFSDMLIHVVDSSAPNAAEQIEAVNSVIRQLKAQDKPMILALNKVDKREYADNLALLRKGHIDVVEISALTGYGIDRLIGLIEEKLFAGTKTVTVKIPYDSMGIKGNLYREGRVLSESYDENSLILTVELDESLLEKYSKYIL